MTVGNLDENEYSSSTAFLELMGLWYAIKTFTHRVKGLVVEWVTDSLTAKNAWTNQKSKSLPIAHLLASIARIAILRNVLITATWIPREQNVGADHLTHARITEFCALHPIFQPADRVRVSRHAAKRATSIFLRSQADALA
jgi:hypothetical protein